MPILKGNTNKMSTSSLLVLLFLKNKCRDVTVVYDISNYVGIRFNFKFQNLSTPSSFSCPLYHHSPYKRCLAETV